MNTRNELENETSDFEELFPEISSFCAAYSEFPLQSNEVSVEFEEELDSGTITPPKKTDLFSLARWDSVFLTAFELINPNDQLENYYKVKKDQEYLFYNRVISVNDIRNISESRLKALIEQIEGLEIFQDPALLPQVGEFHQFYGSVYCKTYVSPISRDKDAAKFRNFRVKNNVKMNLKTLNNRNGKIFQFLIDEKDLRYYLEQTSKEAIEESKKMAKAKKAAYQAEKKRKAPFFFTEPLAPLQDYQAVFQTLAAQGGCTVPLEKLLMTGSNELSLPKRRIRRKF